MGRYLVVAHQTAASPELLGRVEEIAAGDRDAEFVILVPATPVAHQLTWVEGEARAVALATAELARIEFERRGATVVRTAVGDDSPMLAIADHVRDFPDSYDAIIISTFPSGISRWLGLDLPRRVERGLGIPVIHVVSSRTEAPAQAEP
jgi:hypothetical protein